MKKLLTTLLIALGVSCASTALAQDIKIAIIDSQKILEDSKAVKGIKEQVNKKAESFKTFATNKEKELKKKFQDLDGQKKALSKEAFEEKNTKLIKEAEDFNKEGYQERSSIDKAFSDSMAEVEKRIIEIIQTKAKKDKYQLVLFKMQTVFSDPSLDITQPVLDELNKSLPTIKVNFSK